MEIDSMLIKTLHKGWEKIQTFPEIWYKFASKCEFLTNFQNFSLEKYSGNRQNGNHPVTS